MLSGAAFCQDHTLNKHCAYGLRAEMFRQQDCMAELGSKPAAAAATVASKDEAVVKFHLEEVIDGAMVYRSYTYLIKSNGCSTGRQSASDKTALCDKLSNEALNNNCGRDERMRLFQSNDCK